MANETNETKAMTDGRETVGAIGIVGDEVLVCAWSAYMQDGPEGDIEPGWYAGWREPSDDERASEEYARLAATVREAREYEERARTRVQENARAEAREDEKWREHADIPDAAHSEDGPDPALLDALFGDD